METFAELHNKAIKTEVRAIIAELNVALSFLREANETPDAERQRQLIKYAQIVHHAVVRLLLGLKFRRMASTRQPSSLSSQVHADPEGGLATGNACMVSRNLALDTQQTQNILASVAKQKHVRLTFPVYDGDLASAESASAGVVVAVRKA